jgi:aldose 1-epimerase
MNFSTGNVSENGLHLLQLKNNSNKTIITLLPAYGAILHGFEISTGNGVKNIIDNYASLDDVNKNLSISYKSSKLSPFACRIKNAQYTYNGKLFEFENKFVDGNAIHGLLYNKAFEVADVFADNEQCSALLKYVYKAEDAGYPFTYRCEIKYTLQAANLLKVQTTVFNLSNQPIPIQDGWHPYFTLGGKIDDCIFYMQAHAMVEFDEKLIPTGKLLNFKKFTKPEALAGTQFDNCFLLKEEFSGPACTIVNNKNKLSIEFFPDKNYPFLQVYTPPHRNSIAIENLSAAPDAFNNKMGLILLPAGNSTSFTVHYKVTAHI